MTGDLCPNCGGDLYMTAGTKLEFVAECEKCLVRYAFTDFGVEPRQIERVGVVLMGFGFVLFLWFLAGIWSGGQW